MATLIPKPKSLFSYHLSKNKKILFFTFLALLLLIGLTFGAVKIHKEFKKIHRLRNDLSQTQFTLSQYRRQINHLSHDDDLKISRLQQAWTDIEAKLRNQEERIRKLDHILPQRPEMKEVNLLEELKVQREMYLQAQERNQLYEQQLLALTEEMKSYKEQNQLIRQEQIDMRAEYQELFSQRPQVPQEQPLKESMESRLSQLENVDYELERKVKDVQKTFESCAKIGEVKALENYYDYKLQSLSDVVHNLKNSSDNAQLRQDLIKLAEEEKGIKAAFSKLGESQKNHEERLKALENQNHSKVISPKPANISVQSPHELLKEAVENYNNLSKSGHNKKELKEVKKHIKELHHQINQQAVETHQKAQEETLKQNKSQVNQKGQVRISESEILDPSQFERKLGNSIENLINAFVDLSSALSI